MFAKLRSVWGLCGLGLLCAFICVFCFVETQHQSVLASAPPNSQSLWAVGLSLLGSIGFPFAALIKTLLEKSLHLQSGTISEGVVSESVELGLSISAMMKDPKSIPARRRFAFALADFANNLPDFNASHDGGRLIIEYDGFMGLPEAVAIVKAEPIIGQVAGYAAPFNPGSFSVQSNPGQSSSGQLGPANFSQN